MRHTAPPRPTSLSSILILPIPLGLLIIAYLVTLSRRPEIPASAQINDPHQWGYPKWYGNYKSPYDFKRTSSGYTGQEGEGEEEEIYDHPKNVLLFIDLLPNSPKIPKAITTLSSLSSSDRLNVTALSPFSPQWNIDLSITENLRNGGCEGVDWIWRIGDSAGSNSELGLGCGDKVIWIEEEVEKPGRAHISLLSQPHHLLKSELSHSALKSENGDEWELGLLTHILPSADPQLFYPNKRVINRKSIVYFPLPTTNIKDCPKLPWGNSWSIYSPSRKSLPIPKNGEDPFAPHSRYMKYWLKEERRLASAMTQAGICIFEGWQRGLLDDRIVKAMLSGCIVATVPPQTHHDAFLQLFIPLSKPFSVSLQPELPIHDLNQLLSKYTVSDLQHLSLKAFMNARNRLVPQSRLASVERAVKIWEDGGRGYDFQNGFRWDCSSGHGGWCV